MQNNNLNSTTLADHVGNEGSKEVNKTTTTIIIIKTCFVFSVFMKQRSYMELRNNTNGFEENNKMRTLPGVKLSSHIAPGISLDENKIPFTKTFIVLRTQLIQNQITRILNLDSLPRTWSSRYVGRKVSSKNMATRGGGSDDSWVAKIHKAMKKANNSVIGYVSSKSHWPLPQVHISLRPQHKSMEKILSMEIFKDEVVHELRLLDNRLNQWRFANARAHAVNRRMSLLAMGNLIGALDGLANLRYSVVLSKIEFEREKLELKLDDVLHSQMKLLQVWGSIEKRHVTAITIIYECLYAVACRVHLLDGAMDIELASIAQRHAFDLTNSMESFHVIIWGGVKIEIVDNQADKIAELLSTLAEVVIQERFLLEEFDDIFHIIRVLEILERIPSEKRKTSKVHSVVSYISLAYNM
ncbi:QWRF motif-containing protein 3 [Glycine soja]